MDEKVAKTPRPHMLDADEVAELLRIKKGSAYEVIRKINAEQEARGRVVIRGRGAFGCACHGSSNLPVRHRAGTPRGTVSLFVCATIEPPDGASRAWRGRRRVEVGRAGRASTKRP